MVRTRIRQATSASKRTRPVPRRTSKLPYGAEDMLAALAPPRTRAVLSVDLRSGALASPWSPAGLPAGRPSRIVSGTAPAMERACIISRPAKHANGGGADALVPRPRPAGDRRATTHDTCTHANRMDAAKTDPSSSICRHERASGQRKRSMHASIGDRSIEVANGQECRRCRCLDRRWPWPAGSAMAAACLCL
jgi:hypothetical protein